jgi:gas vesicle protein
MQGSSKAKAVGFFVAGAAVGAVATLMLAPKSGAQMRRDLNKLSKRTMTQLDSLQCDIRDQISERYAQIKKMIRTA